MNDGMNVAVGELRAVAMIESVLTERSEAPKQGSEGAPDRPNPLGLHPVTGRAIDGARLRIGPIEAIDGTPVVDIKPVLCQVAGGVTACCECGSLRVFWSLPAAIVASVWVSGSASCGSLRPWRSAHQTVRTLPAANP
jgi:tRNA-methyltransferase O